MQKQNTLKEKINEIEELLEIDNIKRGGRREAKKILKNIKKYSNYEKERDNLEYETTKLSMYLKFGCVSIREVYKIFKKNKSLKKLSFA